MVSTSVSVLIPQWGNTDLAVRAVDAVRRSHYDGPIEIIVFDNGSPGGPGNIASREDVTLMLSETNVGFSEAHNRMADAAVGDFLLLLNNDTVVAPSCIRFLVDELIANPSTGIASPRYVGFDGTVLEVGGFVGKGGDGWQLFKDGVLPETMRSGTLAADYGSAAALLVRADMFAELGGFDLLFSPAYYEDTDLAMRAEKSGFRTVVVPEAVCFHYEGATGGTDANVGMKRYQKEHKELFADRWSVELDAMGEVSFRASFSASLFGRSDRQRILWLAPHLPQTDREAGHLRIYRMIEALREASFDVVFWAENANDRFRYGPLLEEIGVRWFGKPTDDRWFIPPADEPFGTLEDLLELTRWDAVITSFPDFFDRLEPKIRRLAPSAVALVDSPDLHYLREQRARDVGETVVSSLGEESELAAYRKSDGVIASAHYEAEALVAKLRDVPVVAFAVAAEEPRVSDIGMVPGDRTLVLFLGNAGHRPNIDAVEWWSGSIYPRFADPDREPVVLSVVGNGTEAFAEQWAASEAPIDTLGWVADLDSLLDRARVFVVPLRYGAGTKGKIMMALRSAVPIVTTSVGAEGFDADLVGCLTVADDPQDFATEVAKLLDDDEAWLRASRRTAEQAARLWMEQREVGRSLADWVAEQSHHFDHNVEPTSGSERK